MMTEVRPVDIDRLESGLSGPKSVERPQDNELRILIFTAVYFVLDGVTLTIRRLESYMRSHGATVKVLTTVPDDIDADKLKVLAIFASDM